MRFFPPRNGWCSLRPPWPRWDRTACRTPQLMLSKADAETFSLPLNGKQKNPRTLPGLWHHSLPLFGRAKLKPRIVWHPDDAALAIALTTTLWAITPLRPGTPKAVLKWRQNVWQDCHSQGYQVKKYGEVCRSSWIFEALQTSSNKRWIIKAPCKPCTSCDCQPCKSSAHTQLSRSLGTNLRVCQHLLPKFVEFWDHISIARVGSGMS